MTEAFATERQDRPGRCCVERVGVDRGMTICIEQRSRRRFQAQVAERADSVPLEKQP